MTSPHVTLYRGALDPEPIRVDDFDDFAEFADALEDLVGLEHDDKLSMLAWSPHRLRPTDERSGAALARAVEGRRTRATGPYRHLENVLDLSLLVIDVDRCHWGRLLEGVDALGSPAIVYTSPSDDPEGDPEARRARVVLPVDRPILPGECRATRLALAELLDLAPGCGVEGAIDPAKLFFAGRLRGTAPREFFRFGL